MTRKMPRYKLDELEGMIKRSAEELGLDPKALLSRLDVIATKYIAAMNAYEKAETRGKLVHVLSKIANSKDGTLIGSLSELPIEVVQALMGHFPNGIVRYSDIDSQDRVFGVANDDAVMNAAFQNRMAIQAQRDAVSLVRVEFDRSALRGFDRDDEDLFLACLVSVAEVDPGRIRDLAEETIVSLTQVFQFEGARGGRNTNVRDGVHANADWQLYNLVFDEIWPMEKGEIHWRQMAPVRDVVNSLLIYLWGRTKPKRGKGNGIADAREGTRYAEDDDHIDAAFFSAVLTLRHQINSLNCALKIADRQFAQIEASRDGIGDAAALLNALDRSVLYPLRDWRNELARRLEFSDYRPSDPKIRRPTGEILRTPQLPKFKKAMTEHERMHALIAAAAPLARGVRDPDSEKRLLAKAFSIL